MKNFIIFIGIIIAVIFFTTQPNDLQKACLEGPYPPEIKGNNEKIFKQSEKNLNVCIKALDKCPKSGVESLNCEVLRSTSVHAMIYNGAANKIGNGRTETNKLLQTTADAMRPFNHCNNSFVENVETRMK